MAYVARRLPPRLGLPTNIEVPFLARFIPPEVTFGGVPVAQSGAKDLYNPFFTDMYVQRFIARVNRRDFTGGNTRVYDGFPGGPGAGGAGPFIEMKMQDSHGYNVVRDFTPLNHVFDANRRVWTFQKVLGPKEWYTIQLRNIATVVNQFEQPQIIMAGWRKEAL